MLVWFLLSDNGPSRQTIFLIKLWSWKRSNWCKFMIIWRCYRGRLLWILWGQVQWFNLKSGILYWNNKMFWYGANTKSFVLKLGAFARKLFSLKVRKISQKLSDILFSQQIPQNSKILKNDSLQRHHKNILKIMCLFLLQTIEGKKINIKFLLLYYVTFWCFLSFMFKN